MKSEKIESEESHYMMACLKAITPVFVERFANKNSEKPNELLEKAYLRLSNDLHNLMKKEGAK